MYTYGVLTLFCFSFGTSKEGQEFLKSQGVTQTDDDVKTRAQKEKLDEITTEDPPKLARDSTMAVTAKVL